MVVDRDRGNFQVRNCDPEPHTRRKRNPQVSKGARPGGTRIARHIAFIEVTHCGSRAAFRFGKVSENKELARWHFRIPQNCGKLCGERSFQPCWLSFFSQLHDLPRSCGTSHSQRNQTDTNTVRILVNLSGRSMSSNKAREFCTILVLWWGLQVPYGYSEAPPSKTLCMSYG
jgi:hypothetical protein